MLIVGRMMARGEGSTLKRKNFREICGKPLIYWSLKNAISAGFMDEIFVFTEDKDIASIVHELGCRVIERPREMLFYHAGFSKPGDWDQYQSEKLLEITGAAPDISVSLNCNICLLKGETLRQMYIRLMEDELAGLIYPVVEVEPHLYMKNPETGYLFPVWEDPGLDRQKFPQLFRRVGLAIAHRKRLEDTPYWKYMYHVISFQESIDIHSVDDVKVAEMFLKEQLKD